MRLRQVNRFLKDLRANPRLKAQKGRVLAAVAVAAALTATTICTPVYRTQSEENRRLAVEVLKLKASRAQLQYRMYEKDSREPLSGKPLVMSLITQAIKIESLDWDEEQVEAMASICWRESRYNPNGQNPVSSKNDFFQDN